MPSLLAIGCCSDSASVKPEQQQRLVPGHLAGVLFFWLWFSATRDGCKLTVTHGSCSLGFLREQRVSTPSGYLHPGADSELWSHPRSQIYLNLSLRTDRRESQFSSVHQSCPTLCDPQASLSIANSRSLLRLTSIKSVMPSSHHQINHLTSQEKTAASHETKQLIQKKLRAGIGPRTPDSL